MNVRLIPMLAAALAFSSAGASAQISDHEYALGGANALRLNVSGNVHLLPTAGVQSITFHVVDYGPSTPAVHFTDTRIGKRLTISVTGPSQSILPVTGATGYELQITYPANVAVDLREFAGDVQADRLVAPTQIYDALGAVSIAGANGAVTAEADNGSIDLTGARANVQLTAANGAVKAQLAPGWRGNLIRMESGNGALALIVPAGFRGDYDLTTAAGAVHNSLRSVKGGAVVFMLTQGGDVSVSTSNGV